jgi:uncharacterized protein with gpF-like domain
MAKGKAINVKIATTKVITALENALTKLEADYANYQQLQKQYDEAVKSWNTEISKYALSKIDRATNMRTSYRSWNDTLNIDFDVHTNGEDFPKQPVRDFTEMQEWQYKEQKEEISNAIRILKMTDEEVVNTSTYNAVARYL